VVGWRLPPSGSDTSKKIARPRLTTDADAHAAARTGRRSHTRPITKEKTSSVTRMVCTTDSRPS